MNRIAYFVEAKKKPGMGVGTVFEEGYATLKAVLEECEATGRPPIFFLFKNEPDPEKNRKSFATLTVAVSQPREGGDNVGRKPIGTTSRQSSGKMDGVFGNSKQTTERKGW